MNGHEITTGELRSLLQPVVHVVLTAPQGKLSAGDLVALQYWGQGKVTITRVEDGVREINVAHTIACRALLRSDFGVPFEAHDNGNDL
jgi:hypothetical protein